MYRTRSRIGHEHKLIKLNMACEENASKWHAPMWNRAKVGHVKLGRAKLARAKLNAPNWHDIVRRNLLGRLLGGFLYFFWGSLVYWLLLLRFSTLLSICLGTTLASPEGSHLRVSWSKTIQFRERVLEIPFPFIPSPVLCPSRTLWLSLKLADNAQQTVSAFRYRAGPRVVLAYSVFLTRMRSCLSSLGVDVSGFSGHSFRRGGASFAMECGVPCELIQAQGDWRSDAYRSYLHPSLGYRQRVAHTLGEAVSCAHPTRTTF